METNKIEGGSATGDVGGALKATCTRCRFRALLFQIISKSSRVVDII